MTLFSESGMARHIAAGTEGLIAYNDSMGFMIYDPGTGTFTAEYALTVLQILFAEYERLLLGYIDLVKDTIDKDTAWKFYKKFLSAAVKANVEKLLKYDAHVFREPKEFDADDSVINCCGIVVSTDGTKREATPEDLFTMSAAVMPDPGEPAEFLKFMNWATCGDAELMAWIMTAFGVASFGHPTDRIINPHGGGGNGKGTLLRALGKIMDGYATTLPRSLVIKEPGTNSRFDKETLPGKRVAILFDLLADKGKLNLDELKSIAGNGDLVHIEPKGKKGYKAQLKCKIFIASNDKIPITSYGESEKRRFYLVPFNAHITDKDETLEDRFVPEYGKILNLFLEYAANYYANGHKMPPCKAIDAATEEYFDSQDLIGRFINDECTLDPLAIVRKTELYEKFTSYCQDEHGIKKHGSPKTFVDTLEKRGITEGVRRINGKNTRVFIGIITGTATLLQRNANFELTPIETSRVESNSNLENSCSSVADGTKIHPPEGDNSGAFGLSAEAVPGNGESYDSPGQRALWEDPGADLY